MDKCRHCQRERNIRKKGLCRPCYYDKGIRAKYPNVAPVRQERAANDDVSEAELDAMIAEQSKNLPKWWRKATPPQDPEPELTIPFVRTRLPRRSPAGERVSSYFPRAW